MSYYPGQIPLHYDFVGPDGKVNQQWAFWLQNFINGLPPPGSSYVINADPTIVGDQYLYQGTTTQRPLTPPQPSSIFIETDTGATYIANGPNWELQDPAYTGDVTKPQNSTTLTLNTVNLGPGTFGSGSTIPVVTVNSKGLVTGSYEVPITVPTITPGGPNNSIQFNAGGTFAGTGNFLYNPGTSTLSVPNIAVSGQITFTTPITTFNNLSPLTTKGDLLTHDGTTNTRLPVGVDGQLLVADSSQPTGLSWQTITITGSDNVPYLLLTGETYTLPVNKQANFVLDIEIQSGAYLDIGGYLTELINQ